jgi:hypothetical protein
MDPLQLLADLEQLRDKIPVELMADFESLIASIRNIYENTIKLITPPMPVEDGQQRLATHYANLDALQTQLYNRLPAFQEVYVGDGSNSYHMTATTSLQNVQSIRDHLATASQLHGTMTLNFGQATQAQIALDALLVGLGITLAVLIASAGSTAPATVPAALVEAAAGTVTIGIMTEAEAAAAAAILGLMWASLPEALLIGTIGALGTDIMLTSANNLLSHPLDGKWYFGKKERSDTYNQVEDRQWRWVLQQIARRLGRKLTKGEERRLHEAISKQGYDVGEIVEIGVSMFGP